jgi:hypothetical protein
LVTRAPCSSGPGRIGRAPAGLLGGYGAEALGEAAAALVGGDGHGFVVGGSEAFAPRIGEKLLDPEGGAADRPAGGAPRSGQRQGGDEGALDLLVPAVGAAGAAWDGLEIEQGSEGFERILAG